MGVGALRFLQGQALRCGGLLLTCPITMGGLAHIGVCFWRGERFRSENDPNLFFPGGEFFGQFHVFSMKAAR